MRLPEFYIGDPDVMAATATTVFESNAANLVAAISLEDSDRAQQVNVVRRPQRSGNSGARGASGGGNSSFGRRRGVVLCKTHSRYGREAFRCDKPDTCAMRDILKSPGNGPAGRN